jgi:hypothetical protein
VQAALAQRVFIAKSTALWQELACPVIKHLKACPSGSVEEGLKLLFWYHALARAIRSAFHHSRGCEAGMVRP